MLYVPPVVRDNALARVPLLVMHDGQNVFNASTAAFGVSWRAQPTLDRLVAQGSMQQVAVVAIYNTADRIDDYTYVFDPTVPGGGKADAYLDLIEQKVLPYLQDNVPFLLNVSERANVAMIGSSLGGLLACYAGYTRPQVYGRVGCMSSSFWWDSNNFNDSVVGVVTPPAPAVRPAVYVDSGDSDQNGCAPPQNCDDRLQTIAVHAHLARLGWTPGKDLFYYLQKGGVHNEASWAARFNEPLQALFPPTFLNPTR